MFKATNFLRFHLQAGSAQASDGEMSVSVKTDPILWSRN